MPSPQRSAASASVWIRGRSDPGPRCGDSHGWAGYRPADEPEGETLYVCPPVNEKPATASNGAMVGLRAKSAAQVSAFHVAALANGGTGEDAPGPRPQYGPDLYIAYVRDPLGNKMSAVYNGPQEN